MPEEMDEFNPATLDKFETFRKIIARLRGPGGCPWDKMQTHESLKQYLVEECYEVLEAIEDNDMNGLSEELGDLWLQIMLHARIAEEAGEFTLEDILKKINGKLIHRHPHVFKNVKVADADEVTFNWEKLKGREKPEKSSLLSGIPKNLPALLHSQSIQRRAASVGFDWNKTEEVLEKLVEEVEELSCAGTYEARVGEFGDVLFTLANIARHMDIDLESALRQANTRFTQRFHYVEEACRRKGVDLQSLSLQEMDALWDEAKGLSK